MVVFVVDRAGSETARAWDAALAASEPVVSLPAPPVDSMIYTSGTTGRPTGVRRSSATAEQQARLAAMRARLYALRAGMLRLLAAPLYLSAPNFFAPAAVRRHAGDTVLLRELISDSVDMVDHCDYQ